MDEILSRLAKKYAVNEGEICLRWCVDQDIVPVTTSSREQRLSDYLRAMTFKLTPNEVRMVSEPSSFFPLGGWGLCSVSCLVLRVAGFLLWIHDPDTACFTQINEAGAQKHFRGFWNNKFADDDRS